MRQAQIKTQVDFKARKASLKRQVLLPILLFFLILGAVGFFIAGTRISRDSHRKTPISATSPQAEALVNKHLFLTSQDQYLRGKKTDAENAYMAPQIGDSIWPVVNPKKDLGVDHSPDRNENRAFEDLNRYPKELRYTNPDQIIQGQIVDDDLREKIALEDRKEYARQFVENARRNGYLIRLNDDLVVIGVSPIGGAAR